MAADLFDLLLRVHGAEELGRNYVFVRLARMSVAGHLDYSEISRILQGIRRRADWIPQWLRAADRHEALGRAALEAGTTASAGDGFLRAALCAHWATLFALGPAKSDAHRRSLELYARGADFYDPPSERVEIPFDGDVLPGYLRVPRSVERPPVVLMIGGADTNKEELHHWGTELARRGLAVLPFDGPGQGELAARYGRLTMRFDAWHRSVAAVIDWLQTSRTDLDTERIGLFGNSLGGYLSLDAALRDERVGAAISNGGFFDARALETWPGGVTRAFSSCLGIESTDAVRAHVRDHLDLGAVDPAAAPPALVVHGGREDLSEEEEARAAARHVGGTLCVVEDGWHTCTNRDHLVSPLFADWMRSTLLTGRRTSIPEVRLADERDYAAAMSAR
jgi:2,6-dihydroxypseudooxynicotine hydrolase